MQDKYFVPVNDVVVRGKTYEAETVYTITKDVIPELFDLMKEGKVQTYSKVIIKQVRTKHIETNDTGDPSVPVEPKKKPKEYNL